MHNYNAKLGLTEMNTNAYLYYESSVHFIVEMLSNRKLGSFILLITQNTCELHLLL